MCLVNATMLLQVLCMNFSLLSTILAHFFPPHHRSKGSLPTKPQVFGPCMVRRWALLTPSTQCISRKLRAKFSSMCITIMYKGYLPLAGSDDKWEFVQDIFWDGNCTYQELPQGFSDMSFPCEPGACCPTLVAANLNWVLHLFSNSPPPPTHTLARASPPSSSLSLILHPSLLIH